MSKPSGPMRPGDTVILEPENPKLERARWRRNALASLSEGVSLIPAGKAASLYVRRGKRALEFQAELGAADVDVIIWAPRGAAWIDVETFETGECSAAEQAEALAAVECYMRDHSLRYVLD